MSEYASTNYGTANIGIIKGAGGTLQRESYLKFDLSSLSASSVASASLKLYVTSLPNGGTPGAKAMSVSTDTWTETGITWSNKPAYATTALDTKTISTTGTWYTFDITSWVNSNLGAGDKIISVALIGLSTENLSAQFSSREAASNPPVLEVTTTTGAHRHRHLHLHQHLHPHPLLPLMLLAPAVMTAAADRARSRWTRFMPEQSSLGRTYPVSIGSTNYGKDWTPSTLHAAGSQSLFSNKQHFKVASVVFSKKTPDKVFAAVGNEAAQPGQGGFLISLDGGSTWSLKSTVPQFTGCNTAAPLLAQGHPRSVGKLIVLDPSQTNEYIYVGTYNQGVMRSSDDGATWTTLGLGGQYIRGMAIDDNSPQTLYVACYDTDTDGTNEAVYKITNARGTPTVTRLNTSFLIAEELVVINGVLYVAANTDGVWKYEGSTWTPVYTDSTPSLFYSIDGCWDSATGEAIIFAGTANNAKPVGGSTYLHYSVIRSNDSGATWSCLTDSEAKIYRYMPMGDAGGETWWHSAHDTWSQAIMGGVAYVSCQLVVRPH